jgi:alkylation response protein AidB-like acyl-CoA dehydrogenase
MYALLDEEQTALRDVVASFAQAKGLVSTADLADRKEPEIWAGLAEMGLLELRRRDDDGRPLGSGVEVMVTAEELAGRLVPVPFVASGVLAVELLAMGGAPTEWVDAVADGTARYGVLLTDDLGDLGSVADASTGHVWGGADVQYVLALDETGGSRRVARLTVEEPPAASTSVDLTQVLTPLPAYAAETLPDVVDTDSLDRWRALALAAVCADTVGVMRRALEGVVAYSKDRIAYGVPIGTFQAVQHLAAETYVTVEAAHGATCYAAWAVDEEDPATSLLAARTAKAYCASVARTATENVMQLYGGIGQTWEHAAHLYARRALLDTHLLGDEQHQLARIADTRLGGQ